MQPDPDNDDVDADCDLVHIINDLREDTAFCGRPYVVGGPRARFYAGTPIRTPRGINIGAFCVLDDKPRDGLTPSQTRFLRHMSSTVMSHLEMVRAKAQAERARQMVAGLGSFVDSVMMSEDDDNSSVDTRESRSAPTGTPRLVATRQSSGDDTDIKDSKRASMQDLGPKIDHIETRLLSKNVAVKVADHRQSEKTTTTSPGSTQTPQGTSTPQSVVYDTTNRRADDLKAELISTNVRKTYARAVDVLRDSLKADGCMFIDASTTSYGGLVGGDPWSDKSFQDHSDTALSSAGENETKKPRSSTESPAEARPGPVCGVFAASYQPHPRYPQAELGSQIDERFLKKLLRRYPRGRTWNFSSDGISSSDDDCQTHDSASSATPSTASRNILPRKKKNRKTSKLEDGKRLAEHFPGVRSLAIFGIYNQITGRWHAASIAWT